MNQSMCMWGYVGWMFVYLNERQEVLKNEKIRFMMTEKSCR